MPFDCEASILLDVKHSHQPIGILLPPSPSHNFSMGRGKNTLPVSSGLVLCAISFSIIRSFVVGINSLMVTYFLEAQHSFFLILYASNEQQTLFYRIRASILLQILLANNSNAFIFFDMQKVLEE